MYFTFENPEFLWLLFSVPLFIASHFHFLRKSKSKAIKFANFEALKRVAGEKLLTKNMTHLILRVVTILLLITALSGTTLWYMGSVSEIDFVVALDASPSMTAQDIPPSRFDAGKRITSDFVGGLGTRTSLGLVTFSGITFVSQPLTESRTEFQESLRTAEVMRTGGTDIAGAIITSTNLLLNSERSKAILLISDGISTIDVFVAESIREAVIYANTYNVAIYTVGIGTDSGPVGYLPEYYGITAGFDEEALQFIASETGGFYMFNPSTEEITQSFGFVGDSSFETYVDLQLFFPALLLALMLVLAEWVLANTIYRRVL